MAWSDKEDVQRVFLQKNNARGSVGECICERPAPFRVYNHT